MRISKFIIPENITASVDLSPIKLDAKQLGHVVALVGKNGAGKTRVLKLVEEYFQSLSKKSIIEMILKEQVINIPKYLGNLHIPEVVKSFKQYLNTYPNGKAADFLLTYPQLQIEMDQFADKIALFPKQFIKVVDNDVLKSIKEQLEDNVTFETLLNSKNTKGKYYNEFNFFNSKSTLQYIGKVTTQLAIDKFQLFENEKEENYQVKIQTSISYRNFELLKKHLNTFLGLELSYKTSYNEKIVTELLVNNRPFNINQLSPGQKTLFAYAILFYFMELNSDANLKDSIIIIDEPEKHLHPHAQIKLIDAVKSIVSASGQLWIATHSINILAHLDYNQILLVKDDTLLPPSTERLADTFLELTGLDGHAEELSQFINSLNGWAYARFMVECFNNPDVIFSSSKNDPQFQLFKNFVGKLNNISILDFGAGYGRIGKVINEDRVLKNKIHYSAFDPDLNLQSSLKEIDNIKAVYFSTDKIISNSYDCVLLCNVLHEIEVTAWEENIKEIARVLKPGGRLIIIEDLHLPKGENANRNGYLILDGNQMDDLFNVHTGNDSIVLSIDDDRYRERIVFYSIKKEDIKVNRQGVKNAILRMNDEVFEKIKAIRNSNEKSVSQGRLYANYSQLYINSLLAIEELEAFYKDEVV